MELTITLNDAQADDAAAINSGDVKELCERHIREAAETWAAARVAMSDAVWLSKRDVYDAAAPSATKADIEAEVIKVKAQPVGDFKPV